MSACSSIRNSPKYQLGDDVYEFRQKDSKYEKSWVYVNDDSIRILSYKNPDKVANIRINEDLFFLKRSFDVDVMTIGFKYRPPKSNLPRQLNTDFNGNVYVGYRFDRFRVRYKQTPFGHKPHVAHRGISAGVFYGVGSSPITASTTNNQTSDDYNGLTLSRGAALMFGVNDLTVGIGIGWDRLTDRDKDVWIYQNKPWYGLTIGLNLN